MSPQNVLVIQCFQTHCPSENTRITPKCKPKRAVDNVFCQRVPQNTLYPSEAVIRSQIGTLTTEYSFFRHKHCDEERVHDKRHDLPLREQAIGR